MKIRIGTRTSLMAMAQARLVVRLLQDRHPEIDFEFVGIKPVGDQDKTTPLWQMQTIGIFSKEIDEALLRGDIDCAVHSLKDLGTQRPEGVVTAALLKRDDPRDIVLLHPRVIEKLKTGQKIVIGTSAPRRTQLLPDFLSRCLPKYSDAKIEIDLVTLRGNANTRISKLHEPRNGEPVMDGIVLALGGLSRLYNDGLAQPELQKLMQGLLKMVVPVTLCPGAPGQGTVCIETLSSRPEIQNLFKPLHDTETAEAVAQEYQVLKENGGGCHQRFGTLSVQLPNLNGRVLISIGLNKDGEDITSIAWQEPKYMPQNLKIWDQGGDLFTQEKIDVQLPEFGAAFIAHGHALPDNFPKEKRVWVSGVSTWQKLAEKGYWVEGCADGFGFEFIKPTLQVPFLELPLLKNWLILSNEEARSGWQDGNFMATYSLQQSKQADLKNVNAIWLSSIAQYEAIKDHLPATICLYACGPGKTAKVLENKGVNPLYVFPNKAEFIRWADDSNNSQDSK